MNVMQLAATFAALASTQRLQILAELVHGRVHVSELARCVNMSRALLYMHLAKLEAAGFVTSSLELSPEGTALKHIELTPFALVVDIDTICQAANEQTNGKVPNKKEEK
jgi:DNA-binding transcriptional ArsR family regulator